MKQVLVVGGDAFPRQVVSWQAGLAAASGVRIVWDRKAERDDLESWAAVVLAPDVEPTDCPPCLAALADVALDFEASAEGGRSAARLFEDSIGPAPQRLVQLRLDPPSTGAPGPEPVADEEPPLPGSAEPGPLPEPPRPVDASPSRVDEFLVTPDGRAPAEPGPTAETFAPHPNTDSLVRDRPDRSVRAASWPPVGEFGPRVADRSGPNLEVHPDGRSAAIRLLGPRWPLLAFSSLRAGTSRLVLSGLAIVVSVAFAAAAVWILDRFDNDIDRRGGAEAGDADLFLVGPVDLDLPLFPIRSLLPPRMATTAMQLEGVEAVDPRIEADAMILGRDGAPVVAQGLTSRPRGASWPVVQAANPYRLTDGSRPPAAVNEVVIDRWSADRGQLAVGEDIVVVTPAGGPGTFELVGTFDLGGSSEFGDDRSLALFDRGSAGRTLGRTDGYSYVAIELGPGADPAAVTSDLERFSSVEVLDRTAFVSDRGSGSAASLAVVRSLMIGLVILSLLAAMTTLGATFAVMFEHRRRSHALLRAVGAGRGQIAGVALLEALGVGLVASAIGAGLGLAVAAVIVEAIARGGLAPRPIVTAPWPALAIAMLIGMAVTAVAAALPARRAAAVAPIPGLSGAVARPRSGRLAGLVLLLASVGLIGAGVLGDRTWSLGIAAACSVVALVAASRSLAFVGRLALSAVPARAPARLAASHLAAAPGRGAAAGGVVLVVAALLSTLVTVRHGVFRAVDGSLGEVVVGELVVDSGTFGSGGLSDDLSDELEAIPAVERSSGWRMTNATIGGEMVLVSALEPGAADDVLDLGVIGGGPLLESGVAIGIDLSQQLGIGRGDTVPVTFVNRPPVVVPVDSVFAAESPLAGQAVVSIALMEQNAPGTSDVLAVVDVSDGADLDQVAAEVESVASRHGAASVGTADDVAADRSAVVDSLLAALGALVAVAVLSALLGVANAVRLAVVDRSAELGALRIVGMSGPQLGAMVVAEVAVLCVVGAALGTLIGAGLGWHVMSWLATSNLAVAQLPASSLLAVTCIPALLAVLAGWSAARSAARRPPLELRSLTW